MLSDNGCQNVNGMMPPGLCFLKGPSGSGKSAAVRLVAAEADREVHEWRAPVPTLWDDLRYNNIPSSSYSSKVDEFVAFIARAFSIFPT